VAAAAVAVVVTGVGIGGAVAANRGDSETPITGAAFEKAAAAALAHTGGGRVTGSEVGDEESYYEVEVTLDNGKQVDVQLDKAFHVVSSAGDHESSSDTDDGH
jgi:hypothetical protein